MPVGRTNRRAFIAGLGSAAAWPVVARAQTQRKIPTIGVLWHAGNAEEEKFPLAQFRAGLEDIGYVEGRNIILENRFPAEQPERFYALAEELVGIKVDILFTVTRLAALAARRGHRVNAKHPPGPPMTLANMREKGLHQRMADETYCG